MKRLALTVLAVGALAVAAERPITLQGHNFVDLTVDEAEVGIQVGYPGMGGRACAIQLRSSRSFPTSKGLEDLANEITVEEGFDFQGGNAVLKAELEPQTLRYDFQPSSLGTFLTRLKLKTNSGETFAQLIQRLVPGSVSSDEPVRVIVLLQDCKPGQQGPTE